MSGPIFRWGILGPGAIARKFAEGLTVVPDAKLTAVGSRSLERATQFAAEYGVDNSFGSYEELAHSGEVDAIYVATPHTQHCENTLLCLNCGIPVLCEKPFAMNAAEASAMVSTSRQHHAFLMEAMWTRFFPLLTTVKQLIESGIIGEPQMVQASFGFRAGFDPKSRLFDPNLGGGALLDVGIYLLSFGSFLFGHALKTSAVAQLGVSGVDEQTAFAVMYDEGVIGSYTCAVQTATQQDATIIGTAGSITIESPFWMPTKATLRRSKEADEVIVSLMDGNGYEYEAIEVAKCVRNGLVESPLLPLLESHRLMKTLDALREQIGLTYPADVLKSNG